MIQTIRKLVAHIWISNRTVLYGAGNDGPLTLKHLCLSIARGLQTSRTRGFPPNKDVQNTRARGFNALSDVRSVGGLNLRELVEICEKKGGFGFGYIALLARQLEVRSGILRLYRIN